MKEIWTEACDYCGKSFPAKEINHICGDRICRRCWDKQAYFCLTDKGREIYDISVGSEEENNG